MVFMEGSLNSMMQVLGTPTKRETKSVISETYEWTVTTTDGSHVVITGSPLINRSKDAIDLWVVFKVESE